MQALSPKLNWARLVQQAPQPTPASGPSMVSGSSTAQNPVAQTYAQGPMQSTGGQTLEDLLKLQQQQQAQTMPLGQNYLRQFMSPASTNYFQQFY